MFVTGFLFHYYGILPYFNGFFGLGGFRRPFEMDGLGFFVPLIQLWVQSGMIFGFGSVHLFPSFHLVMMDLGIFRAIADEVPIFVATSALERELFIVEPLIMGPISHS